MIKSVHVVGAHTRRDRVRVRVQLCSASLSPSRRSVGDATDRFVDRDEAR